MIPDQPQFLVFDLDGTLVDSRVDLCNSVNAMLAHYGQAPLPEPVVQSYIGEGAGTLVRRALAHAHRVAGRPDPHDRPLIDEALLWFIGYYHDHKLDFTYVYEGVLESLTLIRESHPRLPMAVLTNKPYRPSRAICAHFGLDRFFFANYGGNSFATKKPDPEGLLFLIKEASNYTGQAVLPARTVMVGDSHIDVETARAAGTAVLGCTFGLSPESLAASVPDASVDHAAQWPQALNLA